MMMLIKQLFFSFIASFAFGIVFNVPKRALVTCGFIGMSGWTAYWLMQNLINDIGISNLTGSMFIGILCIFNARRLKIPMIILNTPSIVPLVPGGTAYMAIRLAVEGDYLNSIRYFFNVLWIAGAIVIGIMIVNMFEKKRIRQKVN